MLTLNVSKNKEQARVLRSQYIPVDKVLNERVVFPELHRYAAYPVSPTNVTGPRATHLTVSMVGAIAVSGAVKVTTKLSIYKLLIHL